MTGGSNISRLVAITLILSVLLLATAGCSNSMRAGTDSVLPATGGIQNGTGSSGANDPLSAIPSDEETGDLADGEAAPGIEPDSDDPETPQEYNEPPGYKLLQSASVDLDGDGINEQILVVSTGQNGNGTANRVEGRLLISDGDNERQIVFCTKENDPSGLLSSIEFEDLDGDGAADVFIVIPGYGASFSYSNYFIYSYKKDKSHSFTSDNTLADFIDSFEFSWNKGGNLLTVTNRLHGFSADIVIEEAEGHEPPDEIMLQYAERTWIDPVSVSISEDSRLALVRNGRTPEIKVPLPVFGVATVNMIAEIDLFYRIDSDFSPVLKRCEVIDFSGSGKIKAGSFEVTAYQ